MLKKTCRFLSYYIHVPSRCVSRTAFHALCLSLTLSVGGGELFDRIIDENYKLMELDAVMFIRQICEGLQHMHKMYILHLDLKVGCESNLPLFKVQ